MGRKNMSGTQDDVEVARARELARIAIDTMEAKRALNRKAMVEEYETADMLRRKALEDDPLKKSQYELELAQTLLATEKVKREAAALAAKAAKAPCKARPLAEAAAIVPPLVDKLPQPALAEALVDKLPHAPLAEAAVIVPPLVDELPPSLVDKPLAKAGVNKPQKRTRPPRLPPREVWENMSYEEKKAARWLQASKLQELQELGVVPKLTDAAISRAAAARKAYQDYLAAKKIFDECPLDSADSERLMLSAAAANTACLAAGKRVPPILDPRCTAYCERCPGHGGGVCKDHRLKFDARTEDPAEFYVKAGRL